jgi:hypothetical protein
MSAPRKQRIVVWYEADGTRHEERRAVPTRGPSLWTIPQADQLVRVYCPDRHLAAVLVPNGDGPPVVMVHNAAVGPTPLVLLAPSGLTAAFVSTGDDGQRWISGLGTPRTHYEVDCPSCGTGYRLDAAELNNRLRGGKKKMGLRRP